MKGFRCKTALALTLPLVLSGCYVTKRRLPIPKPPAVVQTVSPEDLVARLNRHWAAFDSLNATVEIQASVLKSREGMATDYTSIRGHILMRKPDLLRVLGQIPVLGTRAFDMASDGRHFTLLIPPKNKAYKGSNTLKKKSANPLENLRPGFFLDALVVRGLEPNDLYSVTSDSETIEDVARKHFYLVPEYVLSIVRQKPGSSQLTPVRVVTFRRDDLLPSEQDLYDSEGDLETQVFYSDYQDFGTDRYPARVTIKRPLDEIQVVLTVDKVVANMTLTDDQFQIKIPAGTDIRNIE